MIGLNDAIERAKLAADPSGYLSAYTFERLLEELAEKDRYSFTMALLDIGLSTKCATVNENDMRFPTKLDRDINLVDEVEDPDLRIPSGTAYDVTFKDVSAKILKELQRKK